MMQSVPIIFYDGLISKPRQATLSPVDEQSVLVTYYDPDERKNQFSLKQMTLIGALGKKNPVIELDNDARIEFLSPELPDWLDLESKSLNKKIWRLERSPSLIIFSVIFVVALAFSVVKWGIPFTAKVVAFELPENTLSKIGDKAEEYVVENWTAKSELPQGQKDQITQEYIKTIAEGKPAKLLFREGGRLGANAIALPNNTIIVTDQLIELAHSDQEILGVLAHEQGHLVQRHSLQQGLSSLGFSVLYIAITGDSSDLMTTLPLAVIGAGYSRQFEKEADLYALKLMDRKGLEVAHFANFLQRLNDDAEREEKAQNTDKKTEQKPTETQAKSEKKQVSFNVLDALSSHPATEERIQMVRDFEKQQQQRQPKKNQAQ